jgi:hypothetical protein
LHFKIIIIIINPPNLALNHPNPISHSHVGFYSA